MEPIEIIIGLGMLIAGLSARSIYDSIKQSSKNESVLKENVTLMGVFRDSQKLEAKVDKIGDRVTELEKIYILIREKTGHIEKELGDIREENTKHYDSLGKQLDKLKENQDVMLPITKEAMKYFVKTAGGELLLKRDP